VIGRLGQYGEIRDVYMAEPDIESVVEQVYRRG